MSQSQILSSARNPLLKDIRRAITRGSLTESGCAVAETFHLLEEALRSETVIESVIAAESVRSLVESHIGGLRNLRLTIVPDALFAELSATESSQGVMALVRMPAWTLDQLFRGQTLVVVFDGLQDPGHQPRVFLLFLDEQVDCGRVVCIAGCDCLAPQIVSVPAFSDLELLERSDERVL